MKVLLNIVFMLFYISPSFAQDESMVVTGSRIFEQPFGPISSQGGAPEKPRPCAEPRCGEAPDDPGPSVTTVQQKTVNNKKAKEKAQKNKEKLSQTIIRDQSAIEKLFAWIKGVAVDYGVFFSLEITTKDGTNIKGKGCAQYHAKLNPTSSTEPNDYCVQREFNNEIVQRANGTLENQLNVTYTIYNACYWEKTCGLEVINFIAGSEEELKGFLNETLGYQYY